MGYYMCFQYTVKVKRVPFIQRKDLGTLHYCGKKDNPFKRDTHTQLCQLLTGPQKLGVKAIVLGSADVPLTFTNPSITACNKKLEVLL